MSTEEQLFKIITDILDQDLLSSENNEMAHLKSVMHISLMIKLLCACFIRNNFLLQKEEFNLLLESLLNLVKIVNLDIYEHKRNELLQVNITSQMNFTNDNIKLH